MVKARVIVQLKGGAGSGHHGHSGRIGKRGGSTPRSGAGAVPGKDGVPRPRPSEKDIQRFISADKPFIAYHITPVENVKGIIEGGLIPGKEPAPGQQWAAEHSKYATYFFAHPLGAQSDADALIDMAEGEPIDWVIAKVMVPRTRAMAMRIVPDEDVSLNPNDGLKAAMRGESFAIIGGVRSDDVTGFVFIGENMSKNALNTIETVYDAAMTPEFYEEETWSEVPDIFQD